MDHEFFVVSGCNIEGYGNGYYLRYKETKRIVRADSPINAIEKAMEELDFEFYSVKSANSKDLSNLELKIID